MSARPRFLADSPNHRGEPTRRRQLRVLRTRQSRPRLELLEERLAPATFAASGTKAKPTLSWSNPANIIYYGTAMGRTQLDATANTAGTFAYSPKSGTVLKAGSRSLISTKTSLMDRMHQGLAISGILAKNSDLPCNLARKSREAGARDSLPPHSDGIEVRNQLIYQLVGLHAK